MCRQLNEFILLLIYVTAFRPRSQSWQRSEPEVELPSSNVGMKRIWNKVINYEMFLKF